MRLLIDPPDSWLAGLGNVSKPAPNLKKVIEILNENAAKVASPDVLKVLPDDIPVHCINNFMVTALDKAISDRRLYQVIRGLLYAKLLKVKNITNFDYFKLLYTIIINNNYYILDSTAKNNL